LGRKFYKKGGGTFGGSEVIWDEQSDEGGEGVVRMTGTNYTGCKGRIIKKNTQGSEKSGAGKKKPRSLWGEFGWGNDKRFQQSKFGNRRGLTPGDS